MKRALQLALLVLALTGVAVALVFTTSSLPNGFLNQSYTAQIDFQSGSIIGQLTNCYVPAAGAGTLPPGIGLSYTSNYCYLSGTPTAVGTYNFSVVATDLQNTAFRSFTIVIFSGGGGTGGISILSASPLPSAAAGLLYDFQFTASGGTSYVWSHVNGSLPQGLSLASDGHLSGIPTTPGTSSFTVLVNAIGTTTGSATKDFQMTVVSGSLRIREVTLPFGIQGQSYTSQLTGEGGGPPYRWSFGSTGVTGLSIDLFSGLITGTPQNAGNFVVPVNLQDATGFTFTRNFNLFVATPLSILTTTLPNGSAGTFYDQRVEAGGGQSPYIYSITSGNLPPGLTMERSTGRITGNPTADGVYVFNVQVVDAGSRVASRDLRIVIGQSVRITTSSLPDGAIGIAYSQTLVASGGLGPYTWTATGVPDGLIMTASTGVLGGTPSVTGSFSVAVTVTDSQGTIARQTFAIQIVNPLTITTSQTTEGIVNVPYSQGFGANGGTPSFTWSLLSGQFPPGLALNGATAVISGTPTLAGSFNFTLQVRDALGQTASKTFIITIVEGLTITTGNLSGTFNTAFSQSLQATGGSGGNTWAVAGGTLPAGLNLNAGTGAITGTPQTPGPSTVTFRVTDNRGQTATRAIVITINLPPLTGYAVTVVNANGSQPGPAQQPPVNVSLGSTFPSEITGTLTLTFAPVAGADDPNVRFNNGLRTLNFIVRQGATTAIFPSVATGNVLTGTVAGTITITTRMDAAGVDITPSPAPVQRIEIAAAPPVITAVQLLQATGGVNVIVTGYATNREVTSGLFRFAVASGQTLQTAEFTVPMTPAFTTWYGNAASVATGSQFTLTVPFTVSANATAITSVTVTLTNSRGNSNSVSP